MGDIVIFSKRVVADIDKAMCFGLAALGDMDSVLELGHFGNMTRDEAIERLKKARKEPQFAQLRTKKGEASST